MDRDAECSLCLDCVRACPQDNIAVRTQPPGADLADFETRRKSLDEATAIAAILGVALLQTAVMLHGWSGWEATVGGWLHLAQGAALYTIIYLGQQYTCLTIALCAVLVLGVTGWLLRVRPALASSGVTSLRFIQNSKRLALFPRCMGGSSFNGMVLLENVREVDGKVYHHRLFPTSEFPSPVEVHPRGLTKVTSAYFYGGPRRNCGNHNVIAEDKFVMCREQLRRHTCIGSPAAPYVFHADRDVVVVRCTRFYKHDFVNYQIGAFQHLQGLLGGFGREYSSIGGFSRLLKYPVTVIGLLPDSAALEDNRESGLPERILHRLGLFIHGFGLPVHSLSLAMRQVGNSSGGESDDQTIEHGPPIGRRFVTALVCEVLVFITPSRRKRVWQIAFAVTFTVFCLSMALLCVSGFTWSWGWVW